MKRLILLSAVVLGLAALPTPSQGQVLLGILFGDKLSSERFHIGLTVGPNLANLSGIDGTSIKPGIVLGLLGEWRVSEHLFLQPELLPFYQVGARDWPRRELQPPLDSIASDQSGARKLSYFEVPVMLKYGLAQNRLHLGAGPQIGFLLGATDEGQATVAGGRVTVESDLEDDLSSTDAGIVFAAEYKLAPDPFATSLGVRYYLGLTDILKDNPGDAVYNRVFTIVASIAMGGADDDKEGN
jgi:hypothetical protein